MRLWTLVVLLAISIVGPFRYAMFLRDPARWFGQIYQRFLL
jgi:hypothetical protein